MLATLLFCVTLADQPFEVVEVHTHRAFGGRLGDRIEQRLTLTRDGEKFWVRVGRIHTGLANHAPEVNVGDELLVHGAQAGKVVFVLPDAIKRVQKEKP